MDILNIRFKEIRKCLKISQKELGDKLGLSNSGISNIEKGIRSVTDKHIKLLSATYNISEQWLRSGEGDMFVQTDGSLLSQISEEYKLSPEHRIVIESFLNLDNSQRDAIVSYVSNLVDKFKSTAQTEKEKELADYPRELDAREKGPLVSTGTDDIEKKA
jgi:transcriptional regulator with XRE-family HTH domain